MRLKLKDITINQTVMLPLVVKSAVSRTTAAGKPYLQMELFDGTDTIKAMYWDWQGKAIPSTNTVFDIKAQVTEYAGAQQLNVKAITKNEELHINEFAPESGYDIAECYRKAYALASTIKDEFYHTLCLSVLDELRGQWLTAPGAKTIHHAYTGGALVHMLSVANAAQAMSTCYSEYINTDLVVAGALLHDVGKLWGYHIDGITCDMTDEGKLQEHVFLGANFISNYGDKFIQSEVDEEKLQILVHIILSHHGKLEYGAAVPPQCLEAHIVHLADDLDSRAEQIRVESSKVGKEKWTGKIWALENRQHVTTQYLKWLHSDNTIS